MALREPVEVFLVTRKMTHSEDKVRLGLDISGRELVGKVEPEYSLPWL